MQLLFMLFLDIRHKTLETLRIASFFHRRGGNSEGGNLVCGLCHKSFSSISSVALHVQNKHLQEVQLLVPIEHGQRADGAQIRSFAIACNWATAEVRNSQRYTKRLMSSSFGSRCLVALRDCGKLPAQGK
jgi:hypothetical protein